MASVLSVVKRGDQRMLHVLLQVPHALEKTDVHQGFLYACKHGLHNALTCILRTDINIEYEDGCGNRGLHYSVAGDHVEVTRLLLCMGANANVRGASRNYPLHVAARRNMVECMCHLVENNAHINARDSAGQTALIVATKEHCFGAIQFLLSKNCGLDLQDKDGRTALHYACQIGFAVDLLLAAGANPDVTDNSNCTPLLLAASEGFSHVVKLLCKAKCNPNIVNDRVHKSALHILSYKGHTDCLDDLLCAGAELNMTDSELRTPLWYAVDNMRINTVRHLLKAQNGIDTYQCADNIPDDACPIKTALNRKCFPVLKMFIVVGFDKNHLMECEVPEDEPDLKTWMHCAHSVMSLKQLCRRWIRHHSPRQALKDISSLPSGLMDFLLLKELDDM